MRGVSDWGVREVLVGSGGDTVGFVGGVGHITDLENDLIYMRARYYDPSLGRFISEDPGQNGTNWYRYCLNNPVNGIDESGMVAGPTAAGAIAAAGTLGGALGYALGYLYAVQDIWWSGDRNYTPSFDWIGEILTMAATGGMSYLVSARGALWGKGIGLAVLAEDMTIAGAACAQAGFIAGMYEGYADYLAFLELQENYPH